jgi:hypothetical protein
MKLISLFEFAFIIPKTKTKLLSVQVPKVRKIGMVKLIQSLFSFISSLIRTVPLMEKNVALGGLVVSVLATGPNVRGFKPGRGPWILRVIKSVARLPSEGK